MHVFLSGDTRTEWQSEIVDMFPDHSFFDPRTVSDMPYKKMAEIERNWVDQSDIVFAYLNKSNPYGYGTCFELGYAVAKKKMIIYIDEKQVSSSKWLGQHPMHTFDNLNDGISQLKKLLDQGNELVSKMIIDSLNQQDFTVLIQRELDDDIVARIAKIIYDDHQMYSRLMLASKMLPKQWYDWNLGYLLQRLNPNIIIDNLVKYPETFYCSEGVAWALGLIGNDDERIVKFLQDQCRKCEDYDAWWCAAHSLQQLNQGDAIDILKRTLVHDEWQDINHCFANIGSRPATIGMLRKIDKSNVEKVVDCCINGLKTLKGRHLHNVIWLLERFRLRDRRVIDALMELHESKVKHGSSVAHRVVEAFGQIAHPNTRKLLEKDLLEAGYFRTRAWAAKGLGLIGNYKSIEPLERALVKEIDPHVLSMITVALYDIHDQEKRKDNVLLCKANWLENGMIIDETNKWYWAPDVYDKFSHAEDPESVSFNLALAMCPSDIKTVLDLGAGTGRFLEEILERNFSIETIYALDNSKEMIEYLGNKFNQKSPEIKLLHSEISKIPIDDNSVDLVVSSWGFPSRIWDSKQSIKELREVYRVLNNKGVFITIGWDEDFSDEMTEIWYRFVMEEEYFFDSLSEYRRRKKAKIKSPRNCNLSIVKKNLKVPVKFASKHEAANVFGHLFGYSAGSWVLENNKREYQMLVSITKDNKESIRRILKC